MWPSRGAFASPAAHSYVGEHVPVSIHVYNAYITERMRQRAAQSGHSLAALTDTSASQHNLSVPRSLRSQTDARIAAQHRIHKVIDASDDAHALLNDAQVRQC